MGATGKAAGSPELVALMLADARLPTGGHTQSAGLEPAVRAGLGADGTRLSDVAGYAADRLRTITRVEAATAVVARYCALGGESGQVVGRRLTAVEAAWAARTPSQALRAASRRQGRAYLRLASRMWPEVGKLLAAGAGVGARGLGGERPLRWGWLGRWWLGWWLRLVGCRLSRLRGWWGMRMRRRWWPRRSSCCRLILSMRRGGCSACITT